MKHLLSLLLLVSGFEVFGQQIIMDWDENPKLHKIENESFLKESAIVIKEDVQSEVVLPDAVSAYIIRRIHKIVRVNDEKGIEMFNKIKFGYHPDYPIILTKARTISPSGQVIELKPSAFKDIKTDDGGMEKIFAMEGVEKGSEIEYIIHQKQVFSTYGNYTLQDVIPTIECRFEFIAPEHLIYEFKGYNQVTLHKDSIVAGKNSWLSSVKNLEGLEEEKYATYYPHFARVEYTLAYNKKFKGAGIRVYTWDDMSNRIYNNMTTFTEKEKKAFSKILSNEKGYPASGSIETKIYWIEHFLKTNYNQQEYVPAENASEIEFCLKNKITDEYGMKRLFALAFQSAEIPFEMGFTTNRFQKKFDYSFLNPENLKEAYFYFPEQKIYLAPNEPFYRAPLIPATWTENQSLHITPLKSGTLSTVLVEKKTIPGYKPENHYHNHDVEVTFNEDIDTSVIDITNTFMGQNALDVLPSLVYLEGEKRDEVVKEIIRISEKDERIDNISIDGNDFSKIPFNTPVKIKATIHATNNIEKAGNKYLFKIGELIGRQAEMYQEKPRKFDLEIPNPHQYTRKLKINIPKGYKVSGADKLIMNMVANRNGEESCKFVSSYKINGNVLEVECFEVYKYAQTPISEYEAYKKVINAAADFNKIVIVFEKL